MKKNVLFISGSPRKGNTEYIITKLFDSFDGKKDIIYLRKQQINYCNGCLTCNKTKACPINDDMKNINMSLIKADLLVIGSPNYYDNVPGILKSLIDRTNPLFHAKKLKNKKIFFIITGGGRLSHSERVAKSSLKYFEIGRAHV